MFVKILLIYGLLPGFELRRKDLWAIDQIENSMLRHIHFAFLLV